MLNTLTTIGDWIRFATSTFYQNNLYYGHGTDNPLDEAASLVLGALNLPFDLHHSFFTSKLMPDERKKLIDLIQKRVQNKIPTAYLTKRILYSGLEFYIDQRALIPRSPIAELINKNLAPFWPDRPPESILDLCCGSGCIGLLAEAQFPNAQVTLADIDKNALEVAKINQQKHHSASILVQSDLFMHINQQFDWILCNPPYVSQIEQQTIPDEYRHEPEIALYSGKDGLDFIRKLLHQADNYLTDEGILVMEVGKSWNNITLAYPQVNFNWVDLEKGGDGVMILTKDELTTWRSVGVF